MPEYRSMLIASQVMRRGSVILAGVYLLSRLVGGYFRLYGSYADVASVTSPEGQSRYVFETVAVVIALGIVYVFGECVAALRDIARNSFKADTKHAVTPPAGSPDRKRYTVE